MHAKNDRNHEWASKPPKKVSSSWSAMHAKNDRDYSGGFKTPKKSIISIIQILWQKWSFSSRGSKKPQKLITTQKKVSSWLKRFHVIACQKWSSSSRSFRNQKKVSSSLSKMHAKNDRNHEWASKPPKKVSSSWSAMHAKNDRDYSGCFKTQKKSIISIIQILWQKWSFLSRVLKKTSKTDHNPKKSITMTEKISCHCMSKMIIIFEGAQKHLKTPLKKVIFFGHHSPPSIAVARWILVLKKKTKNKKLMKSQWKNSKNRQKIQSKSSLWADLMSNIIIITQEA